MCLRHNLLLLLGIFNYKPKYHQSSSRAHTLTHPVLLDNPSETVRHSIWCCALSFPVRYCSEISLATDHITPHSNSCKLHLHGVSWTIVLLAFLWQTQNISQDRRSSMIGKCFPTRSTNWTVTYHHFVSEKLEKTEWNGRCWNGEWGRSLR